MAQIQLLEITTPARPPTGYTALYVKSDSQLYSQDSLGNELLVGVASDLSGSGGAALVGSQRQRSATWKVRNLQDRIYDSQPHVFDVIPASRHAGLLARTDVDPCDGDIQSAINAAVASNEGSLILPPAHMKLAAGLSITSSLELVGCGSSYTQVGIQPHRDNARTRLYWDTTVIPGAGAYLVKFETPAGGQVKTGGGLRGVMLDGMTVLPRGLWINSWMAGYFEDIFSYAATEDQILTTVVDWALSAGPADVQGNTFIRCMASTFGGSGWYLTNTARGWRLTGGSSFNTGNTSFNTFLGCDAYVSKGDAWTLENTDNNYLYDCKGKAAYGATSGYDLILGSADQDSSNAAVKASARFNMFLGGQWTAQCRAAQSGGTSSDQNCFFGLSRANSAALPVLEAGAGGSVDATAQIITSGEAFLSRVRSPASASGNALMVLGPAGTGALQAQVADNGTGGGAARGAGATDWQRLRVSNLDVASGTYSTIGGGQSNRAIGANNTVGGGNANQASLSASTVAGGNNNHALANFAVIGGGNGNVSDGLQAWVPGGQFGITRGIIGRGAWASARFSISGDAQSGEYSLIAATTDATQTRLTADALAAGATNQIIQPNNSSYHVRVMVIARQISGAAGAAGDSASWIVDALVTRGASSAVVTVVGGGASVVPTLNAAGAVAWRLAVAADATNGGLAVSGTGEVNKNIQWVARALSVETVG